MLCRSASCQQNNHKPIWEFPRDRCGRPAVVYNKDISSGSFGSCGLSDGDSVDQAVLPHPTDAWLVWYLGILRAKSMPRALWFVIQLFLRCCWGVAEHTVVLEEAKYNLKSFSSYTGSFIIRPHLSALSHPKQYFALRLWAYLLFLENWRQSLQLSGISSVGDRPSCCEADCSTVCVYTRHSGARGQAGDTASLGCILISKKLISRKRGTQKGVSSEERDWGTISLSCVWVQSDLVSCSVLISGVDFTMGNNITAWSTCWSVLTFALMVMVALWKPWFFLSFQCLYYHPTTSANWEAAQDGCHHFYCLLDCCNKDG